MGAADFAVFRPSGGNWYLLQSSNGFAAVSLGAASDKILLADFDGDGRTDPAVFRPANGNWYFIKSSDGDLATVNFGAGSDTPIPSIFLND